MKQRLGILFIAFLIGVNAFFHFNQEFKEYIHPKIAYAADYYMKRALHYYGRFTGQIPSDFVVQHYREWLYFEIVCDTLMTEFRESEKLFTLYIQSRTEEFQAMRDNLEKQRTASRSSRRSLDRSPNDPPPVTSPDKVVPAPPSNRPEDPSSNLVANRPGPPVGPPENWRARSPQNPPQGQGRSDWNPGRGPGSYRDRPPYRHFWGQPIVTFKAKLDGQLPPEDIAVAEEVLTSPWLEPDADLRALRLIGLTDKQKEILKPLAVQWMRAQRMNLPQINSEGQFTENTDTTELTTDLTVEEAKKQLIDKAHEMLTSRQVNQWKEKINVVQDEILEYRERLQPWRVSFNNSQPSSNQSSEKT